jgi:hypothetical protein
MYGTFNATASSQTLQINAAVTALVKVDAPVINATNGLIVNNNTVSASYTIPTGSSASSVGPMIVAIGQSVTVPSGSRWVIL